MIGMGKLGLPVALAIESRGHDVFGFDVADEPYQYILERQIPYQERDLQPLLDNTRIKMLASIQEVVDNSDIVFVPIQTPHDPQYEGITRIPAQRSDFDYTFLESGLATVAAACRYSRKRTTVAVISTCLPGTYDERLADYLNQWVDYVYTPQFIAMGTVLQDYLHPEFNLIGVDSMTGSQAADQLKEFYASINDAPNVVTDIVTAEAIKLSYNTWITAKTVLANAWGEMADKVGANFDDIREAWGHSDRRLLSLRYMDAGMSDGGGCHPRDNIAMSWLSDRVGMSHNIWEDLMAAREHFEEWHAKVAAETAAEANLPLVLLGRAFKPGTNIETGSPAILLSNLLHEMGVPHASYEDWHIYSANTPHVYFIATQHRKYETAYKYPQGSIVIDPFGYITDRPGVDVIRLGRRGSE